MSRVNREFFLGDAVSVARLLPGMDIVMDEWQHSATLYDHRD